MLFILIYTCFVFCILNMGLFALKYAFKVLIVETDGIVNVELALNSFGWQLKLSSMKLHRKSLITQ